MHIVGSIFIFNIFLSSPRATFPLCLDAWFFVGLPTSGGAALSCALLALHQMVEAAEGTKPERCLAPAPISVFDLRFELSSFIFIHIMARVE
jgi:hypothetical protein